ncbi:hypothetical protein TELCIR_05545 [Teladorsagia circumcincta]|uniref:Uncharacterized protein n=1 Tax=Teladorsagia circumcincta TaxID=45464 RepID=A0A2G9UQI9_TELCI|nr:hypothetical protein TELCIR_05545 [Teladorsagia circumcincta]
MGPYALLLKVEKPLGPIFYLSPGCPVYLQNIWFDLVAPELGTNMAVESWLNGGADDLDSICTRRTSIYDVTAVTLPDVSFNSSRDHSKWAVADTEGRTSIVCVGDLNRQVRT